MFYPRMYLAKRYEVPLLVEVIYFIIVEKRDVYRVYRRFIDKLEAPERIKDVTTA